MEMADARRCGCLIARHSEARLIKSSPLFSDSCESGKTILLPKMGFLVNCIIQCHASMLAFSSGWYALWTKRVNGTYVGVNPPLGDCMRLRLRPWILSRALAMPLSAC